MKDSAPKVDVLEGEVRAADKLRADAATRPRKLLSEPRGEFLVPDFSPKINWSFIIAF
jgi:hypothetical protein